MSWRDDAINQYVPKMLQILAEHSPGYREIVFVGKIDEGVIGASAIYYDAGGKRQGVNDFLDFADQLQATLGEMHAEFKNHGDDWRAVKITLDSDKKVDAEFDYEDAFRWQLHEFPKKL